MSDEQVLTEEGSHYEVSLTASQAFVAFVLLLLSLAASFAFGLLIGKGQGDDRMAVRHEAAVVNEAATSPAPRTADLTTAPARRRSALPANEDSRPPLIQESSDPSPMDGARPQAAVDPGPSAAKERTTPTRVTAPSDFQEPPLNPARPESRTTASGERPKTAAAGTAPLEPVAAKPAAAGPSVPYYAQLMSTSDQKAAEALAAKLIDNGFTAAYVERGAGPKGETFRVRIKFPSEVSARAAIDGLKPFSREVWVTRQP